MKQSTCAALLVASIAVVCQSNTAKVSPLQKVIDMLLDMKKRGAEAKHEEEVKFATFKQFCEATKIAKERHTVKQQNRLEKANTDAQQATQDAKVYASEIQALNFEIERHEERMRNATAQREEERAFFEMESMKLDTTAKTALWARNQLDDVMSRISGAERERAHSLRSLKNTVADLHSSAVKMKREKSAREHEQQLAFEVLLDVQKNEIANKKKVIQEKSADMAIRKQDAANAQGDSSDASRTIEDNQNYLQEFIADCEQKAGEFAQRQQIRAGEMEAVQKAVDILSGSSLQSSTDALTARGFSFAQIRSESESKNTDKNRAAEYLLRKGRALNSQILLQAASQAKSDVFEKVKRMISDMIVRQMEEANEETAHKGWCDKELATNTQTRYMKSNEIERLKAAIDLLQTSIATLAQDLADLSQEISELDAAVAKSTELRQQESAKNEQTVNTAKESQNAVTSALQVLRDFYAKSAERTVFSQEERSEQPGQPTKFKGTSGATGVLGLLEVILSDFTRLQVETQSEETVAQKTYETFVADSNKSKAKKKVTMDHKNAKKQDQEQEMTEKQESLVMTERDLTAAEDYYEKLKPDCIGETHGNHAEGRAQQREEEIKSLKEALAILNGEVLQ